MSTSNLQVSMTQELKRKASKIAEKQGFSSLQEIVRVFLNQLAANKVAVSFDVPLITLSKKNDERYSKMIQEVQDRKIKTKKFKDINNIMKYLNT